MSNKLIENNARLSRKLVTVQAEMKKDKTYAGVEQTPEWIKGFETAIRLVKSFEIGKEK